MWWLFFFTVFIVITWMMGNMNCNSYCVVSALEEAWVLLVLSFKARSSVLCGQGYSSDVCTFQVNHPGLVDQLNSIKNIILSNLFTEHPQVRQSNIYIYIYIYISYIIYENTRLVMLSTLAPLQSIPSQTRTLPTHNVYLCIRIPGN